MESRILEIIFFLFDSLRGEKSKGTDPDKFIPELQGLGYTTEEITQAFGYLKDRQVGTESDESHLGSIHTTATRLYSNEERYAISVGALGLITDMVTSGVLGAQQAERIILQAVQIRPHPISSEQLRLLISSILASDIIEHRDAQRRSPDSTPFLLN